MKNRHYERPRTHLRESVFVRLDAEMLAKRIQSAEVETDYFSAGRHTELMGSKAEAKIYKDVLSDIGYTGSLHSVGTKSGYPELTIRKVS